MTLAAVEDEGRAVVAALESAGAPTRLLGGVAVAQHRHDGWPSACDRPYGDIDVVTGPKARRTVEDVLVERGYEAAQPFNRLHGDRRLLFLDQANGRQVDVFLGRFAMCHRLDLGARLGGHPTTLTVADLLLTKLQVVEINFKDVADAVALIHQHPLGDEADGDVIGTDRLVAVTSADWGWWTTFTDNLDRVPAAAAELLDADGAALVAGRVNELRERLDAAPKGMRWKARARIGRRVAWYDEPEEHEEGIHG